MKELVFGKLFEGGIKHCGLKENKLKSRDLGAIKLARICHLADRMLRKSTLQLRSPPIYSFLPGTVITGCYASDP